MGHQGENDSAKISSCASYGELIRSVEPWRRSMEHGLIGGKPFSPFTVKYYSFYIDKFLKKHKELSLTSLKKELLSIPVEQYGKRDKLYKAVVCFAKYLINEKALNPYFLNEIKPLQPKRHKPPKRTSINEVELDALLAHCQTIRQYTTVLFLAATGLRASEFCNLQWDDVNLEEGYLVVRCGKGGKRRKVGFGEKVAKALRQYRDFCIQEHGLRENVFLSRYGEKTDRHGLRSVLGKLGKRAGVEVTPHVLRRAFITHNANKGKPLNMLQIAAGHSDIKTTMKYCRTTEDEVVEMMKGWD
jgi:integrase/recombinase XerD